MTASGVMDGKTMMEKRSGFFAFIFSLPVLKKNLVITAVVCVVLSVANQYDILLNGPWSPQLAVKVFINFVIPFVVSSVAAWSNRKNH